ncbi:MAG: carbohydrate kinase [Verrucomicrobiales bacterium]|nr:carbohydrate kinase [Verrucomicrobiales bacterium]
MAEEIYIAIDLGAESGRVMAGAWDGSRMRLEEIHRFPNGPVWVGSQMHWDLLRLWQEIEEGLQRASRRFGKQIVSIGADTWALDFVILSKSKQLLGWPYHYRDSRTRGMVKRAFDRVSREEIFEQSGLQFMEINSLYQLLGLQESSPEILEQAEHFLMIADYIHWCLSGRITNEYTNATTTQLVHPTKREWSLELLTRFGLPRQMFGELTAAGTSIGPLQKCVAERCGIGQPSIIIPATHDTASAVIGVPTRNTGRSNWAYISSGTWSLVGIESPEPILSSRALELNFTNEGGVDGTYRVLKNVMGLWLVQQCRRSFESRGLVSDYPRLLDLAAHAKPFQCLMDPDDAAFLNPTDMPQAIQEFCRKSNQAEPKDEGALVRCALESLALKYRVVIGFLEELSGEAIEVIHVVGGGCRNSLLNQLTADACERRVVAGPVEATALGNVMIQARAKGALKSVHELRESIAASSEIAVYHPQPTREGWDEAIAKFGVLLAGKEVKA